MEKEKTSDTRHPIRSIPEVLLCVANSANLIELNKLFSLRSTFILQCSVKIYWLRFNLINQFTKFKYVTRCCFNLIIITRSFRVANYLKNIRNFLVVSNL